MSTYGLKLIYSLNNLISIAKLSFIHSFALSVFLFIQYKISNCHLKLSYSHFCIQKTVIITQKQIKFSYISYSFICRQTMI